MMSFFALLFSRFFRFLITLYQKISYWLLPYPSCRFYPSCSNYALQALEKYSLTLAIYKIVSRLLKCNPFHPGGIDRP